MGQSEPREKYHPPEIDDEGLNEEQIFERAMEGVRPLSSRRRLAPPRSRRDPLTLETVYPSELIEEALQETDFQEWPFAPGYLEGGDLRWNRRLLRRLRRGKFRVQAELDLHGCSQLEARDELQEFLRDSVRRGLSCVRVIHGKGHHSPNQTPVLKSRLPEWLSWRQNARYVAAFTSADPRDGGAGAVYILLKRWRRH